MYIGNQPYQSAFLTDLFSGNGGTTFTMSVAPANTASVLVAVSGVLQSPDTYSVVGTTLTFTQAPPTGTGNISARYLGIPASGVTTTAYRTVTTFTATASQTTFTPPSYTVGFINVYRNGVLLTPTSDYTASNGTTVVLASGAASGDTVIVESFLVSSVLNAIPNTAGSVGSSNLASNLTLTTPTISGNLNFASGTNGIVFNNTNATVNSTLNDYETGSWTPAVLPGSGTLTSYTSSGSYTKIGSLVNIVAFFRITSVGTAGGGGSISNVPFASTNVDASYQPNGVMRETGATGNFYALYLNNNSTLINFQSLTGGSIVWTNNYCYAFTLTYKTTF